MTGFPFAPFCCRSSSVSVGLTLGCVSIGFAPSTALVSRLLVVLVFVSPLLFLPVISTVFVLLVARFALYLPSVRYRVSHNNLAFFPFLLGLVASLHDVRHHLGLVAFMFGFHRQLYFLFPVLQLYHLLVDIVFLFFPLRSFLRCALIKNPI